jgi:pyridoxal phosphate enzyme (YggS family)
MSPAVPADRSVEIRERLAAVEARIAAACAVAGRARADVTLVAVTKTWPAADVAALLAAADDAPRDLGEARDQEAARKVRELAAAGVVGLRWHFVGRLQTNKARSVASYADVVHSVDRLPLVPGLGDGARRAGRELAVLLQLSLDGDPTRGGALPGDVPALADAAAGEDGLRLAGVMAVAPRGADPAEAFHRLAAAAERLRRDHPEATWLSAGMSGDLEQGVAVGATHLRVGSALFGGRPVPGR